MKKTTFGVIIGNRGFFPDILVKDGRKAILDQLKNQVTSLLLWVLKTSSMAPWKPDFCPDDQHP